MRKKKIEFEDGNKLTSSLCGLKYKDLFRYFSVIGKYHFLEKKIFKDGVWNEFSNKGKELAKKLEVEKSIKYKEYREQFDMVISRALAPMPTIIEYSAPFLKNGGKIISYKGSNYKEEIEISKNALNQLNCTIEEIKEYNIDELNTSRYVIIIKKHNTIPNKYPRKQNKPRLNPL